MLRGARRRGPWSLSGGLILLILILVKSNWKVEMSRTVVLVEVVDVLMRRCAGAVLEGALLVHHNLVVVFVVLGAEVVNGQQVVTAVGVQQSLRMKLPILCPYAQ